MLDALCPPTADGASSDACASNDASVDVSHAADNASPSPAEPGAQRIRLKSLDLTHSNIGDAGFELLQTAITSERLVVSDDLAVHEGNHASG